MRRISFGSVSGSPDAPSADARLWDVFEDLYAFLLDDLAVIVRKLKQIPVPGSRNGVPSIRRQILFRDLPTFQRLASYLVVGGKADACAILPQMQIAFIINEVNSFFFLLHQQPPFSNTQRKLAAGHPLRCPTARLLWVLPLALFAVLQADPAIPSSFVRT